MGMNDIVQKNDTIVVWFSCGAASAIAAKETLAKYGHIANIRVVNNPVKEEHEDNRRFFSDVEKWLNIKIETAINPNYINASCVEVWNKRRYMSGNRGAPCTLELKKRARQHWEEVNKHNWIVLGFTVEEEKRATLFQQTERENLLTVLIDKGITKQDCIDRIQKAGIELPVMYKLGYPNANCIGCAKASSPNYWNLVRETHPEIFKARAEQSREVGCRLVRVNGRRIFLDELMIGHKTNRKISHLKINCSLFCEE